MSQNKSIPFSGMYAKLKNPVFPTIRRNPKPEYGEPGDTVTISVKNGEDFEAELIAKRHVTLKSLSEDLLVYDTCPMEDGFDWDVDDAREKLNSFYQKPIRDTEKLTLYIFFRG
jgi:hypothetical protein